MISLIFAILSAFRLTQVVIEDTIFNPVRYLFRNWPRVSQFISCYKCVSVWTSSLALVFYWYYPLINWPFAISFLYGTYVSLNEMRDIWLDKKTPKLVIRQVNGNTNVEMQGLNAMQADAIIRHLSNVKLGKVS